MPEIGKALEEIEWLLPTNIQSEAIPLILGGGDVLMAAETGSGKTGAFCLPVIQIVWETLHVKSKSTTIDTNKWVLSAFDRDQNLSLTTDGLSAQSKTSQWQGVRANKAVKKVFFLNFNFALLIIIFLSYSVETKLTDFIMKFIFHLLV